MGRIAVACTRAQYPVLSGTPSTDILPVTGKPRSGSMPRAEARAEKPGEGAATYHGRRRDRGRQRMSLTWANSLPNFSCRASRRSCLGHLDVMSVPRAPSLVAVPTRGGPPEFG
jgi:hypothetical protein